jgi:SecD/SecF fusion protein
MLIVFLYLLISFRKWQYGLGAIAAVAHDVIFVLGIYSLFYKIMPFGMEIDQHFIAAILTVIGYSMNDTVIVFDRVREFLDGKTKGTFPEIVNKSINSTMSRTINTSLTMIGVLAIMFILVESLLEDLSLQCLSVLLLELILLYLLQLSISRYNFREDKS